MNIVFVYGEVLDIPQFKFIVEGKHISIVIFDVRLMNGSEVVAKVYDGVADLCYMRLDKGSYVVIKGSINSRGEIEAEEVEAYDETYRYFNI